jgi:hypothetical protein
VPAAKIVRTSLTVDKPLTLSYDAEVFSGPEIRVAVLPCFTVVVIKFAGPFLF